MYHVCHTTPVMREIIVIAHNMRSTHNVGSLLRTADGLGVQKVIMTGYTPYPNSGSDERLPHIAEKLTRQIHKTALGAENTITWQHQDDIMAVIAELRQQEFWIAALEQAPDSVSLPSLQPPEKIAIILGREVEGVEAEVLAVCDAKLEIPMFGAKESFNVSQAAAIAMYHCRFNN